MENYGHTNDDTRNALTKLVNGLGSPTKAIAEQLIALELLTGTLNEMWTR